MWKIIGIIALILSICSVIATVLFMIHEKNGGHGQFTGTEDEGIESK